MADPEDLIFSATERGDEERVSELLDAYPELVEYRDEQDTTPLVMAAYYGWLGLAKLLLQRGANINAEGRGRTALHWAATCGHEAIVAFLISEGAQVDTRDSEGDTPVMSACGYGHLGLVKMLLQHRGGQGLDDTDLWGGTALHLAAIEGYVDIVTFLLSEGVQANIRDEDEMTPLMCASEEGHLAVVQILLRHRAGQGLDERCDRGKTALHYAAYWGCEEVVRFLILAGADPTIRDNWGSTPRREAEEELPEYDVEGCRAGRARCVTLLTWWDGELERSYVLYRATRLHKAHATQRDMPTSQLPTYLEARVAAAHAVPGVEVVSSQSDDQQEQAQEEEKDVDRGGKRRAADEGGDAQGAGAGEEERRAVLEFVVQGLNEELLIELLEGNHFFAFWENAQEDSDRNSDWDSDSEDEEDEEETEEEEGGASVSSL